MEVSIGPYTFLRGTHSQADTQVRPYAGEGEVPATTRASGAQRSVCASGCEEMGGNRGRDHPQSAYQHRTIPQSRLRRTSSLYTRGPLRTGDADCRVASLLAMTVLILCHSEEAQRADVGIRPFYDGRGFGPPYLGHGLRRPNFVPKFGASVKSSAPTERNGSPPLPPEQRLAKRKARKEELVKFGFCPIPSECSTAYNVRKPQQSPARVPVGAASTEQNSLEPRPAARQGA